MGWNWRSRGKHWRDITNPRFYRLALDRAYEIYPDMEDAHDEHDGTIEVILGSRGASLTLRLVDGEAISLFAYGHCVLLAYAIYEKTNLPLIVFTNETAEGAGWHGHAGISLGDDKILDITGICSEDEIHNRYGKLSEGKIMSAEEFKKLVVDPAYVENPFSFLDELEQFVVKDFADHLISEYSLKELVR
jgi:hypothetical protein